MINVQNPTGDFNSSRIMNSFDKVKVLNSVGYTIGHGIIVKYLMVNIGEVPMPFHTATSTESACLGSFKVHQTNATAAMNEHQAC